MSATNNSADRDAFNERVGRANIKALRVAVIALVISTVLGLAAIVISLPTVQRAVDARILDWFSWLTARWTLAWPVWVALLLACIWLGMVIGRRQAAPQDDPIAPANAARYSQATTVVAKPPPPHELRAADQAALAMLAKATRALPVSVVASRLNAEPFAATAALNRLVDLKLAATSSGYYTLTKVGIAYVDEHQDFLFGGG